MHERPLGLVRIVRASIGIWFRHAPYLTLLAAIVLAPIAAFELAGRAVEVRIDTDAFDLGALALGVLLVVVLQFAGEEIYAGTCEHVVSEELRGEAPIRFGALVAHLPLARMVGSVVLYSIVVGIAFLLFVIPGLVLIAYFAVTGPVIVLERKGVRASFRRSFELVRGHFWPAFAIVVVLSFGTEVVSDLIAGAADLVGAPHWIVVVAEYGSEALLMPLTGVCVVVLYYALVDRENGRERATSPPVAGP